MEKELKRHRDNSILTAYFDIVKRMRASAAYVSTEQAVSELMKRQAPRFFTTFENARRIVSLMARGHGLVLTNDNKRDMYTEIYRRYVLMREQTGATGYRVLEQVLEQPAPSYYVDAATMRSIVYRVISHR